ncbi:MAG: hypothetical protein ACTSPB_26755, partial [Candidatus Thorarchaeota archaeon]
RAQARLDSRGGQDENISPADARTEAYFSVSSMPAEDKIYWEADVHITDYAEGADSPCETPAYRRFEMGLWNGGGTGEVGGFFGISFDLEDSSGLQKRMAVISNYKPASAGGHLGSWYSVSTGTTYKIRCELSGSKVLLYVNNSFVDSVDIAWRGGAGDLLNYNKFVFGVRDHTRYDTAITLYDLSYIEGWLDNLKIHRDDLSIVTYTYSTDPNITNTTFSSQSGRVDYGYVQWDSANDRINFEGQVHCGRSGGQYYGPTDDTIDDNWAIAYWDLPNSFTAEDGIRWEFDLHITDYTSGTDSTDLADNYKRFMIWLWHKDTTNWGGARFGISIDLDDYNELSGVRAVYDDGDPHVFGYNGSTGAYSISENTTYHVKIELIESRKS